MNAHVTIPADRILLPRGLVGRPVPALDFRFTVGEMVEWEGEHWLVLDRHASLMGRHSYTVFRAIDERPTRQVACAALASRVSEVFVA